MRNYISLSSDSLVSRFEIRCVCILNGSTPPTPFAIYAATCVMCVHAQKFQVFHRIESNQFDRNASTAISARGHARARALIFNCTRAYMTYIRIYVKSALVSPLRDCKTHRMPDSQSRRLQTFERAPRRL